MAIETIAVTLHVVSVILWVGGGITLLLGADMAWKKRGAAGLLAVVDVVALLGPVFFVPVSLVTLLSGVAAAWYGPGFGQLWVNLGLVGFAATFLTGILLIKPRAEGIAAMMSDATQDALARKARDLVTIARFDYVVLVLVVLVMLLKPASTDIALLGSLAIIAGLGAVLTLGKGMRGDGVTPAR